MAVERMCVVTRERRPPEKLVRLVLSPEGRVEVDYRGRLQGRGAWITPRRELLEKVEKHPGILTRPLKATDVDASGLLDRARAANERAFLDALSICARAGALTGGKDGVRGTISSGAALAIVLATDASPRLCEDLKRRAEPLPVETIPLDREQLGVQVGKGPRAALAVRRGRPGRHLLIELHRMVALR
ncbi:MAG: DUF448 domain-containing protein [Proteobacteria bacterium]|nr:DUF448 domain-containing protein [Pseudomonadota bacterium]MCP4916067.1 DUF448 domain-containing protein [Pseudomonadota bacterium]